MSVSSISSAGTNVADVYAALKAVSTAAATTEETRVDATPAIEAGSTNKSTSNPAGSSTSGQLSSAVMGVLLDQQASGATEAAEATSAVDATAVAATGSTDSGSASESGTGAVSSGSSTSTNTVYDSADSNEDGEVSAAEQAAYDDEHPVSVA